MTRRPFRRPDGRTGADDVFVCDVAPEATDPQIDDWLHPHRVALRRAADRTGCLLLFLSGSRGRPRRQQSFLAQAAAQGHHAINLHYPNTQSIGSLCRGSREPDAHERVRLQIIDGRERTELLEMHPANSIVNRLRKLLVWLDERHREDGWGSYLDGDGIRWAKVVVAGHSQGGGHAALLGKHHAVARVVMLASPVDFERAERAPAAWLQRPGETPPSRYFGFVHQRDQGFDRIQAAWSLLGLAELGPVVDVDQTHPPYQHTHRLTTDLPPAAPQRHHGSVVVDGATPRAVGGAPVFEPVWDYLLRLG